MSESPSLSWSCSACGRRVPRRVERCHCGRLRDAASAEPEAPPVRPPLAPAGREAAPGRPAVALWRSLSADVKALVVAGALLVVGGVGWALFGPQPAERLPALLGYVELGAPRPPQPPTKPPFKLPWWR